MSTPFSSLDRVTVGQHVDSITNFILPQNLDISSAIVTYRLIDLDGATYFNGEADTITTIPKNGMQSVQARAQFTVPDVPATQAGDRYQLKWTITLDGHVETLTEYLTIFAPYTSTLGANDVVELELGTASLTATLDTVSTLANLTVYKSNTQIYSAIDITGISNFEGTFFQHQFVPQMYGLTVTLRPYTVIWDYQGILSVDKEMANLWVVNPSILSACKALHQTLNRLQREYRLPELEFSTSDMMRFLEMGMDRFNSLGIISDISMTMAEGPFRHWWLVCSQIAALRSRYLEEAESTFDFSGQAVSLNVDITSLIDGLVGQLESQVDGQLIPFKMQMGTKGLTVGTGQYSSLNTVFGSVGLSQSAIARPGIQSVRNLFLVRT